MRMVNNTVYQKYWTAARARKLFEEYRKLARLVDDLDIRFWKRFVLRNCYRCHSIENELAEDRLRDEYKSCVSDLMLLRARTNDVLDSISSLADRAVITDFYIRDMSIAEIMEKWDLKEREVQSMIQRGLMEANTPDEE